MEERHDGMAEDHARPHIAHHLSDFFPHGRFVAMNRAVAAGCFFFLERAMGEAQPGIIQKLPAIGAERSCRPMMIMAIDVDHRFNGFVFPRHSWLAGEIVLLFLCRVCHVGGLKLSCKLAAVMLENVFNAGSYPGQKKITKY